ncbi:acetyltransferase [Halobaculum sp. WSA2]|uniref:Acetyltransferase n=1 Tax=Halobaculum saliterrae TaxID=2073113 RepID=A0A6B0SSF8_9EURY|nr:acyltransferase [Halobaculum saliterrae]MXR41864.1 acetyltransferase [Halobaculum saliterrae]
MSGRYVLWRLAGARFLWKHKKTITGSREGLKIRGDVRLLDSGAEQVVFGNRVELVGNLGQPTFFKVAGRLTVHDDVFINRGCEIYAATEVVLKEDATLAPGVVIRDSDVHAVGDGAVEKRPVTVGESAWLGTRSIILKGVTIGDNAVVGAGSIVTDDVPPNTVVAGNPAKVVKEL